MSRLKAIFILLFFFKLNCFSQIYYSVNNDYSYLIERSVIDTFTHHSGIKPFYLNYTKLDSSALPHTLYLTKKYTVQPIANLDFNTGTGGLNYEIQAGVNSFSKFSKKLIVQLSYSGSVNKYPDYVNSTIDSNHVIPFFGRYDRKFGKNYLIQNIRGVVSYMPKKYVTIAFGHDKHFWGDGYRSLFLSDHAAPYSFASFSLQAWRLKYVALWAYLPDINFGSGNTNFYGKYGSFHYLSVNLTNRLNFGFFESIISWSEDTLSNRGLEWTYLNPFIFFRSVEYSMHSPDNAVMGGSMKLRLWRKTYLYGQLFLDDLMVKELFSDRGWYGNKFAIQAGYKTYNLFNISQLFLQQEINYVRPYVYGHSEVMHNYGVRYQPLAHPLGANFQELITSVKYSFENWFVSGFISFAQTGKDTSKVNYGQNIYKNPINRPSNYGVHLLQGLKTNNLIGQFTLNYCVHKKWQAYAFTSLNFRYTKTGTLRENNMMFSFGIKTLLFHENIDW